MHSIISEIIDTKIIPVLLLPVTGLLSLVFYNRAAAVNQRLRSLQKELRDAFLQLKKNQPRKEKEMIAVLQNEVDFLHRRGSWIRVSLVSCLLAVASFSVCALFVALSLFFHWAIDIALIFWFFGPILICVGAVTGIVELILSSKTIHMQSLLVQKWEKDEVDD